jgi:hypothetical protein
MEIIKRKLKERHDKKYNPQPGDRIANPLSEFKTVADKRAAYNAAMDCREYAMDQDYNKILLGNSGAEFNNVEFIGGIWRIQTKFDFEITPVRDRQFVLLSKLPHQERTLFEFYRASHVAFNCYGPFCSCVADYVVAKYETDNETYWSYGRSVEEARAFLGIKMYDEYMYLINSVARQNMLSGKPK